MDFNLIKKLIFLIDSSYIKIAIIFLFFLIISIFDLIGLSALGAFISVIVEPESFKKLMNSFGIELYNFNIKEITIYLSLFIISIFILKSIFSIFIHYKIIKFSQNKQMEIRLKLLKNFKKISYEDFISSDSSSQITTIGNFVKIFGTSIQSHFQFFGDIIISIIIILFLASINLKILVISCIILLMFIILYKYIFLNSLYEVGKKMNNAYTRLYQNIAEYFEGFKELRILGNYNYFYDETKISTNEIAKSDIRQSLVTIAPRYILETIVILLAILLLLFNYESERGILNILPTLAIFGAAILRLVPIANQITRFYSQVRYGKDAIDRIYEQLTYLNHLNIINEEKNNQDLDDFNSLQIESLRYKYPSSSEENLFVEKFNLYNGEAVGIIGKSGSGKTTLIDLIMGLLNTHSGSIKVNNIKLSEIYEKWWHMVAYLPQDVFLINNSIALNIALGSEEKDINYKRLTEAIEKAKLTEFINSLPDGIETNIGQRGIKISGGQKQRIALARTFYYDRKIIILDEATNSLDSKIEDEIYNEIKSLKGDITLIIISHRTKSLDFCDRIYEVKNKTVKEI